MREVHGVPRVLELIDKGEGVIKPAPLLFAMLSFVGLPTFVVSYVFTLMGPAEDKGVGKILLLADGPYAF